MGPAVTALLTLPRNVATALINPTLWLLACTAAVALHGAIRGETARQAFDRVLSFASPRPVASLLVVLALSGVVARAVVGYRSGGLTHEQMDAIANFTRERQSARPSVRAEFARWLTPRADVAPPWTPVPGVTECPAQAMGHRIRLFTPQAHSPLLLLTAAAAARAGAGQGLTAGWVGLSLIAAAGLLFVALKVCSVPLRSRHGLLVAAVILGWQPVLAGVRQADGVLPTAALLALAWYYSTKPGTPAPAFAAMAAVLSPVGWGGVPGLLRVRARAGLVAVISTVLLVGIAIAVAGFDVAPGYAKTLAYAARTYAAVPVNYSILPRIYAAGVPVWGIGAVFCVMGAGSWCFRAKDPMAVFVILGLMVAPVVWSQHLAVLCVPAFVLLRHTVGTGSAAMLAAVSTLLLLLSLPDQPVSAMHRWLSVPLGDGVLLPAAAFAIPILWVWIVAPSPAVESPAAVVRISVA